MYHRKQEFNAEQRIVINRETLLVSIGPTAICKVILLFIFGQGQGGLQLHRPFAHSYYYVPRLFLRMIRLLITR